MTMFTSKRPTCAGRTLDLPRKDRDIRCLRPLGNSDIAENLAGLRAVNREVLAQAEMATPDDRIVLDMDFE